MKPAIGRVISVALLLVALLGLLAAVGCGKQAPQLTPEQLAAGVIGAEHPVSQEEAMKQGCACHTKAQ